MKLRILFVLALCSIMLVASVACKAGSSYGGMTAEQIIQNMEAAALSRSSVHLEGTEIVSGTVQETWGEQSLINMVANITGDIDTKNLELSMNIDMDMNMTTGGHTENQMMNMQMYLVDGWMYEGMDMMGKNYWYKIDFTDVFDEMYEQQRDSMLQSEELIEDAIEVNVVDEETVNGVVCWKLDIQPDLERLFDWAQSEMSDIIGNLPSDVDLGEMFQDIAVTEWVAKDTYYPIRCDMTMTMNIEGAEFDASATMNYSNFNQPVTITLPAAAIAAEEISY